jgi:hypothetical protein
VILLCGRELLRFLLGEELDLETLDSRPVDVEHVEAHAVVDDLVPLLGRTPELAEDKARDGVVVLLRQVGLELLVEVVDRERAVSPTISSSRSSSVTIPWKAPYSSTTSAMCWFVRLNSASIAARSFVSGTTWAGRTSSSTTTLSIPRS